MARKRATAIVVRDDKLLLVKDKGKRKLSLPGGGVNRGEPPRIRVVYDDDEAQLDAERCPSCKKPEFLIIKVVYYEDN